MKWNKESAKINDIKHIHTTYNIDLLSATILARRKIDKPTDILYYLEDDLTYLHSPFHFDQMNDFVERVNYAIEEGENIRIHGDRDVDGITSTALLYTDLLKRGAKVSYRLPVEDESYGLTKANIDEDKKDNINLIITVDCGTTAIEEIDYANKKKIDVLVVDHHLSLEELPDAHAIINPKAIRSSYPFKDLVAAAVVSKCMWALDFSKTPYYEMPMILLYLSNEGDYISVQALLMKNLVPVRYVNELYLPGKSILTGMKFYELCSMGYPIYTYDADIQLNLLKKIFTSSYDIHLIDLKDELGKAFPSIKNQSLSRIKTLSKSAKYYDNSNAKLLEYLFKAYILKTFPSLSTKYDEALDLVAIASIGDLMPMKNENRILVKRGLKRLETSCRASLSQLMHLNNMVGIQVTTKDIAWNICPIINSSGRMGQPNVAVDLLISESFEEINKKTNELVALNKSRKKISEDLYKTVEREGKKSFEHFSGKLIMIHNSKMVRGVSGIMAARLVNQYKVPSIVIASVEDNKLIASGRSIGNFNMKNFLDRFEDLFLNHGGHAFAGGFSMQKSKLDELSKRVEDFTLNHYINEDVEEEISIDASIPQAYMKLNLIDLATRFEPYGEENPPLTFLCEGMKVQSVQVLKDAHLKLLLESNNIVWSSLYWNAADKFNRDFALNDNLDVVFRLSKNYYKNTQSIQLTIVDAKKST